MRFKIWSKKESIEGSEDLCFSCRLLPRLPILLGVNVTVELEVTSASAVVESDRGGAKQFCQLMAGQFSGLHSGVISRCRPFGALV
jgi:hypothetical protein